MEIALPNAPLPLDGPLIRAAVSAGAEAVPDAGEGLRLAVAGRAQPAQAIIAMAYRDAFDGLGIGELLRLCVDTDVDAVLLPQHDITEQIEIAHRSRAAGLEQVLFIHLEDDLPRLAASELERPVIYLQSADLQTGGPFDADKAIERVLAVRRALAGRDAYVLVGFGVRGRAEAEALLTSSADGVIVGTALVRAAGQGPAHVRELMQSFQPALPKAVTTVG